jgi:hypothetical protein
MNPPSFTYTAEVTFNTSSASSTHFLRYIDQICSGLDFEFAFKVRAACSSCLVGWVEKGKKRGGGWRLRATYVTTNTDR